MGKKNAQLRVVFSDGVASTLVLTTILQRYDLYTVRHIWPIEGKHSYHASGVSHSTSELVGRRVSGSKGTPLRDVKGCRFIDGFGAGKAPDVGDYQPKPDGVRNRSLVLAPPAYPWGIDIWAVERRRQELAARIIETQPWPKAQVVGSIQADWTDPIVVVTVWQGLDDSPYEVLKLETPVPGEIPYVIVPGKYAGTWLEPTDKGSPARRRMQREAEDFVARRGSID